MCQLVLSQFGSLALSFHHILQCRLARAMEPSAQVSLIDAIAILLLARGSSIDHPERVTLLTLPVDSPHLAPMWLAMTSSPPDTNLSEVDADNLLDFAKAAVFHLCSNASSHAQAAGSAVATADPARDA